MFCRVNINKSAIIEHTESSIRQFIINMVTSSNGNIFALLAISAGNSPDAGAFPAQRQVTRNFDIFFDLCLNKRLSKQSWGWWFGAPSRPLCRHCDAMKNANTSIYKADLAGRVPLVKKRNCWRLWHDRHPTAGITNMLNKYAFAAHGESCRHCSMYFWYIMQMYVDMSLRN